MDPANTQQQTCACEKPNLTSNLGYFSQAQAAAEAAYKERLDMLEKMPCATLPIQLSPPYFHTDGTMVLPTLQALLKWCWLIPK